MHSSKAKGTNEQTAVSGDLHCTKVPLSVASWVLVSYHIPTVRVQPSRWPLYCTVLYCTVLYWTSPVLHGEEDLLVGGTPDPLLDHPGQLQQGHLVRHQPLDLTHTRM